MQTGGWETGSTGRSSCMVSRWAGRSAQRGRADPACLRAGLPGRKPPRASCAGPALVHGLWQGCGPLLADPPAPLPGRAALSGRRARCQAHCISRHAGSCAGSVSAHGAWLGRARCLLTPQRRLSARADLPGGRARRQAGRVPRRAGAAARHARQAAVPGRPGAAVRRHHRVQLLHDGQERQPDRPARGGRPGVRVARAHARRVRRRGPQVRGPPGQGRVRLL